jgi:hypothetical protein
MNESTLQKSLQITKTLLNNFISQPDVNADLSVAFGSNFNTDLGLAEIESLTDLNFNNINIEIRPAFEINNARGAYSASTNTVYLSEELIADNNHNAIANVLLEEVGHYLDAKGNSADALGDEGAIFASLVSGKELTNEELSLFQTEDDTATIDIDGASTTIEQAKIIYVRQGATGDNNGTSWANAYTDLQSAIANAEPNDEVWVAAGTYKPTTDLDRSISFNIREFAQFYGGFAGTETERDQRDIEANETILSGNIGTQDDRTDNSYHVVDITSTAATTVLDGFTITGGYALDNATNESTIREEDVGGGIYSDESGNARLSNLKVVDNFAFGRGAGIYLDASSNPVLTAIDIINNETQFTGGGLHLRESSPTLNSVTFSGNLAGDSGGGVSNFSGNPVFSRVIFNSNVANNFGGGLFNIDNNSVSFSNSLFSGNQSQSGGAIYNEDSDLIINNSTIYGNQSDFAGAVYNFEENNGGTTSRTESAIDNSIVVNNFGSLDGLQVFDTGNPFSTVAATTVNNSIFQGGYNGAGVNIFDVDPRFINPGEGNFRLRSGSPAIDRGDLNLVNTDFDLVNQQRVVNDTVDLGAYEFPDNLPDGTVYRFFNPQVGVHFYTASKTERDSVIDNLPQYQYEGASFKAFTEQEADSLTGAKPVYRFFNENTGVHLYTINELERTTIQDNFPNYNFEGIAYYAYETQQIDTIPLYRFYNPVIDAHFYTPSAVERDSIIQNLPDYQLEGDGGVTFYVEAVDE